LVPGRDDDLARVDASCGGADAPAAVASLDALRLGTQPQLDARLVGVPLEVCDDVIAAGEH
jgi:hypothetical protein